MTNKYVEDTASTNLEEHSTQTDEAASTGLPPQVVAVGRPGLLIATLVLSAALATIEGPGTFSSADFGRRKRDDAAAESSTVAEEVNPLLLNDIRELFDQGTAEFFNDGMHSKFSHTLLNMLALHGQAAFRAIANYVFSGNAKPDVISEALRWLADYGDASTLSQRWIILRRALQDRSPRVRDGAILGFAALDDPRARPLLLEARNLEQMSELRTLIDQVVAQLDRA